MKLVPYIVAMVMFSGCAGIVTDKRDVVVRVSSNPSGALVEVNANHYLTPASILLPRGEGNFRLTISKNGYAKQEIILSEADEPWVELNFLNLCVGCVVDVINGAASSLEPREIHVRLQRE